MNKRKNRITCVGELLIDFICRDVDVDIKAGANFLKKPGGAPANVAAAISKLGGEAYFAGKVGADPFGKFLKEVLQENGVNTQNLIEGIGESTTLAFVSLKKDGERDFVFNRGADGSLEIQELDLESILDSKIIHFGSATALLEGKTRETYLHIIDEAKKNDIFVSFDPNYREDLWKHNEKEFIEISRECIKKSNFLKVSEEELYLIGGREDFHENLQEFKELGAEIICVTLGSKGVYISSENTGEIVETIKVKSIDSTGAGDAFVGAFLHELSQLDNIKIDCKKCENLRRIAGFANRVGAVVCTKLGAMEALPTREEMLKE